MDNLTCKKGNQLKIVTYYSHFPTSCAETSQARFEKKICIVNANSWRAANRKPCEFSTNLLYEQYRFTFAALAITAAWTWGPKVECFFDK